uniref:Uncharacterized protein n=1 Tax=Cyprinodon variegatus TaxID=28743 RepID=A0A3Q2GR26_CYPVA
NPRNWFCECKATTSLQTCLTATFKSSDSRKEFVEDFVAMFAEADIPLEKMTKLHQFLKKHCKQGEFAPRPVPPPQIDLR